MVFKPSDCIKDASRRQAVGLLRGSTPEPGLYPAEPPGLKGSANSSSQKQEATSLLIVYTKNLESFASGGINEVLSLYLDRVYCCGDGEES